MLVDAVTLADELSHLHKGVAMRHPRLLAVDLSRGSVGSTSIARRRHT